MGYLLAVIVAGGIISAIAAGWANGYRQGWCQGRGYTGVTPQWVWERPIVCVTETRVEGE